MVQEDGKTLPALCKGVEKRRRKEMLPTFKFVRIPGAAASDTSYSPVTITSRCSSSFRHLRLSGGRWKESPRQRPAERASSTAQGPSRSGSHMGTVQEGDPSPFRGLILAGGGGKGAQTTPALRASDRTQNPGRLVHTTLLPAFPFLPAANASPTSNRSAIPGRELPGRKCPKRACAPRSSGRAPLGPRLHATWRHLPPPSG